MTKTIVLFTISLLLSGQFLFSQSFLDHEWNETQEVVVNKRNDSLFYRSKNYLKYKTKIDKHNALLGLKFRLNHLIEAHYLLTPSVNSTEEINLLYLSLYDKLKSKLGNPSKINADLYLKLNGKKKALKKDILDDQYSVSTFWKDEHNLFELKLLDINPYPSIEIIISSESSQFGKAKNQCVIKDSELSFYLGKRKNNDFHYIILENSLSNKYRYTINRVLDNRKNQENIGSIKRGMIETEIDAVLYNPLEIELKEYLNQNLLQEGPNISIIINEFKVAEFLASMQENGLFDLDIDFILENDSGYFKIHNSKIHIREIASGITDKQPYIISRGLSKAFDELNNIDLTKMESMDFIHCNKNDRIIDIDQRIRSLPIFTEKIKEGIYQTYDELRKNNPSIKEEIIVNKRQRFAKEWKGTYSTVPRYKSDGRLIKNIYAFCYQDTVYISHQNGYFPLKIEKERIHFIGRGIPDASSVNTAGLVGGLAGAGIAAGIEKSQSNNQRIKYFIDPITGRFGPEN